MKTIKLSVLDEAIILKDHRIGEVFERSIRGAQYVENLGYERLWFAEHHNMANVASAATAVLVGHIAGATNRLRVGAGGIMLPNHSPLVIAEQFGTLESLYPNRIDLGLGRAPGADQLTAYALRRGNLNAANHFEEDIHTLQKYFSASNSLGPVRSFPGEGLAIPLYILGSSTSSAQLAASLGLPYVFAAHFAPAMLEQAAKIYRANFRPSAYAVAPYFMVAINVIAAETDEEAKELSSSLFNLLSGLVTNEPHLLAPPTSKPIYEGFSGVEQALQRMTTATFVGDQRGLSNALTPFVSAYEIDELMITNYIFDEQKKLKSYSITKDALAHLMS